MKQFSAILLMLTFCVVSFAITAMDSLAMKINEAEKLNNPDLYYNLGIDYFSAGDLGMANLNYLKALNLNSAHTKARANLELCKRLSPDAKLYPQHLFLVRALLQGLDFLSINRAAYLSLLLLLLSGASLMWLLFYDPNKERALPSLVLILCVSLCIGSFIFLGVKSYRQRHNRLAVVVSPTVELMSLDSTPKPILEVHSGLIVTVMEHNDKLLTVRLPNGQMGMLPVESLRLVIKSGL